MCLWGGVGGGGAPDYALSNLRNVHITLLILRNWHITPSNLRNWHIPFPIPFGTTRYRERTLQGVPS